MSILRDNVNSGPSDLRNQMNDFVVSAGVFNGISALIAQRAGFRSAYLSGSGIAGAMGLPDLSVTTLTEVSTEVRRIVSVAKIPLIVDIDTGFGEAINVIRTVREMENAGASAIHMEDQVLPKRCGHLSGKSVIASSDMVKKIKAAVSARKNPDFVIIARTDARSVNGIEDAISRANEYIEAGADAIFSEALESRDEFLKFSREVRAPLMANMTEFGKSPLLSVNELRSIGYKMVIFPLTAFRAVLKNMDLIYRNLYSAGTQRDFMDSIMSRKEFYDIIGYSEYEDEDRILGTEE
ncbi:MAG: methylisocitrate lyase [Candidatus Thermoplasmatota archaeon]|nr:methylisocitrate lyase [Candidatus Thermoplasmatota archaeon]